MAANNATINDYDDAFWTKDEKIGQLDGWVWIAKVVDSTVLKMARNNPRDFCEAFVAQDASEVSKNSSPQSLEVPEGLLQC